MDILLFSLSCIMPFFIYLAIGYTSKILLKLRQESFSDINKLAFYTFLPVNLFLNIYGANFDGVEFAPTLMFSVLVLVITVTLFWLMYSRRNMPDTDKSVLIQSLFRTNFILFGIPLTERILGQQSTGLAGILTAIIIPAFNVLAVIVLTVYGKERSKSGRDIVREILTNPLIVAAVLGIAANGFGVRIDGFTMGILHTMAITAIPVALMALGGRFDFSKYEGGKARLAEALFYRLLLVPAIVTTIAAFMGFRGEPLALILVLFASPTSVTSYTMAQQMGANEKLAAKLLVYGTVLSSLSLFVFISAFKVMELF